MVQPEHSKIINKIAKQILSPVGIFRKGQSRKWLDDRGWFTTIIEFQPSGFSKGIYLNVGVNFHWYPQNYWSFDIGNRENGFIEFGNEEQFAHQVEPIAKQALDKVLYYRKQMSLVEKAKRTIVNHSFASDGLWGDYHRAVFCGLTSDSSKADQYFNSLLLSGDDGIEWIKELKEKVIVLKPLLNDKDKFRETIFDIIRETRKLKRLPEVEISIG